MLLILLNSTAAEARVAWPHRDTSLAGVNHLNPKQEPLKEEKPKRDKIILIQVDYKISFFLFFSKYFPSMINS